MLVEFNTILENWWSTTYFTLYNNVNNKIAKVLQSEKTSTIRGATVKMNVAQSSGSVTAALGAEKALRTD